MTYKAFAFLICGSKTDAKLPSELSGAEVQTAVALEEGGTLIPYDGMSMMVEKVTPEKEGHRIEGSLFLMPIGPENSAMLEGTFSLLMMTAPEKPDLKGQ